MYLTPEEMFKRKQRKKFIVKFIAIPLAALAVGAAVALLGSLM